MLKLYDVEDFKPDGFDIVRDIEDAFAPLRLVNDEVTKSLLREVEQAEYLSESKVIDRFGMPLYISELSSGCKAALCVQYLPDKVIDLVECGLNSRDAIISFCEQGSIFGEYQDICTLELAETTLGVESYGTI